MDKHGGHNLGKWCKCVSSDIFVLNVTHRKNGNSEIIQIEKIVTADADIPGLPHERADWVKISKNMRK